MINDTFSHPSFSSVKNVFFSSAMVVDWIVQGFGVLVRTSNGNMPFGDLGDSDFFHSVYENKTEYSDSTQIKQLLKSNSL